MKNRVNAGVKYNASDLVCGLPTLAEAIVNTGVSDDIIQDVIVGFRERQVVRIVDVQYMLDRFKEAKVSDTDLITRLIELISEVSDSILEYSHDVEFEVGRLTDLRIMDGDELLGWAKILPRLQLVSESIVGSESIPVSHFAKIAFEEFFTGTRLNYSEFAGKSLDEVAGIWRKRFRNTLKNVGEGRLLVHPVDPVVRELNREMYDWADKNGFVSLLTEGISYADTKQFLAEQVTDQGMFNLLESRYGKVALSEASVSVAVNAVFPITIQCKDTLEYTHLRNMLKEEPYNRLWKTEIRSYNMEVVVSVTATSLEKAIEVVKNSLDDMNLNSEVTESKTLFESVGVEAELEAVGEDTVFNGQVTIYFDTSEEAQSFVYNSVNQVKELGWTLEVSDADVWVDGIQSEFAPEAEAQVKDLLVRFREYRLEGPSDRSVVVRNESIHIMYKENCEFVFGNDAVAYRKLNGSEFFQIAENIQTMSEARFISEEFQIPTHEEETENTWNSLSLNERKFLISQYELSSRSPHDWEKLPDLDTSALCRIL
jgi:hypothetical protein